MNLSLYFHIPFCTHRCAYCDFNTYAGQERLIPAYVEALCREVEFVGSRLPSLPGGGARGEGSRGNPRPWDKTVHTIFFGGGTPSLLTPKQFEQILQTVRNHFDLYPSTSSGTSGSSGSSETSGSFGTSGPSETSKPSEPYSIELSLEANPGTVTLDSLRGLRRAGFNRISFGVQSFNPGELRQLERIHDPFDVLNAVGWARQAGFDNLNLDLIYGLPEQPMTYWQTNVKHAVELNPEHLSLYALTIEHGTPYGRWAAHGLLPLPDPDLAADMYEWASEYLEGQGYEQYEISNWARPGFQCRHNLQYWRNLPYLGFGAGAHGCANGMRISDVVRIKTYIERLSPKPLSLNPSPSHSPNPVSPSPLSRAPLISPSSFPLSPATVTQTRLTSYVEMQETMMLGLRLTQEGISETAFLQRFGQDLMAVFGKEIDDLLGLGLLEWDRMETSEVSKTSEVIRLTPRGRLLGNQVFLRFVGD